MENKLLYSVLFLKGRKGTNTKELSLLLKISESSVRKKIHSLKDELKNIKWPLEIKENQNKVRLTVSKEISLQLSKTMDKTINISLTKSVLEALTVIAYKQPTTKLNIEQIRGVSADYAISKLLEYELIESNERSDLPGRPRLYVTTEIFLELFDLDSLEDLPKASIEFKEKTQETTLFLYDSDEEEKIEVNKKEKKNE
ncbi:MAG: SMC-Scp complex subunit ScpB [Mycoplasmataceae bacterium]|nr:SMC-Scp complex subunit ScpB [Mycoplasmataceae bacterium]